mgnify:FL=1
MAEKVVKLEVQLEEYCKKLENIEKTLNELQKDTRARFEDMSNRLTALEIQLKTTEQEKRNVINIRLWLIGLSISTILALVGMFLKW